MANRRISWTKEIALFLVLLLVGMVALPAAVYVVGQQIIGEYAEKADWQDLISAVWADLGQLNPATWLLVLSPYIVIMLLRVTHTRWKPPRPSQESG